MELLLNMTIGGTVTACVILLIKLLLKDKLTPKWHFYLWVILMVRLMIPGFPESDFSLLNVIPTTQNVTTVVNQTPVSVDQMASAEEHFVEGNILLKSPVTGVEQRKPFSVSDKNVDLLFFGWVIGAILMAGYLTCAYGIFYKRVGKLLICKDTEVLKILMECKREAGIHSDHITLRFGSATPMLLGLFKPTILIPEGYSREELRHVLLHELCHYKHKDILINIICCTFLCAYWFNPIMWLCFYTIRRDIEILCDERVIEIIGERKMYAKTLLKTTLKRNQFVFATTSMQNGEKEVAKRIKHIAYFKKPKVWGSVLAVLVVLVTGLVCLTNASGNTVNMGVGSYFVTVPERWFNETSVEPLFYDEKGESFGGINVSQVYLGENKKENFNIAKMPRPNHSRVLEHKAFEEGDKTYLIVNLDFDIETAAQIAQRNASGDDSPSRKINQNYIFVLPDETEDSVYTIWANSSAVTEKKLVQIARTLQKEASPQEYQPETAFQDDWANTAEYLLKDYFKNYVDMKRSMSSDISGYRIDYLEPYEDQKASWNVVYPNVAVFRVDYTLDIAYPDQYSFAGDGFQIGEANKTKLYHDQLAVFQKDDIGTTKFLGFVWPQAIEEMGEAMAVLHTISYTDQKQSPEALLERKTPYIGNHSADGGILRALPLAGYSKGLELYTKEEPYGLTVYFDLTEMGDKVFKPRPDKAMIDSSGWDLNPYLEAQLYKNSAILLALIDNCSTVEFEVKGLAETGALYTYHYFKDRQTLTQELSLDPRKYTESLENFKEFFDILELTQFNMVSKNQSK